MNAASAIPTVDLTRNHANEGGAVRIAVKGLNFYYGSFHGLKNVDINFHDRQVTALIGPSGDAWTETWLASGFRRAGGIPG